MAISVAYQEYSFYIRSSVHASSGKRIFNDLRIKNY